MKLFTDLKVGEHTLKNRLVMPPMATGKSQGTGEVTADLIDFYEARANGGHIGLIITEHSYVCDQGKASATQLSIKDDGDISGLKSLVDAIHQKGSMVIAQINHAGSAAKKEVTLVDVVGPSAVVHPNRKDEVVPKALTKEEILIIQEAFTKAAKRAELAGFDGVEIHSAHSYLLNQFYSPITNHREDEYGPQSIENRVRFQLEIIEKIKEITKPSFIVAIRLGGCDYQEGGSTIQDAVDACILFEKAGVHLLDLSGGMCGYSHVDSDKPGFFKDMTLAIKQAVSVPVLLTGGVTKGAEVECLLNEDAADLIGVGRALFKDYLWCEKEMINE